VSYPFDQFLAGLVVLRAPGKRHDTIVPGDGERLRVDQDTFRDGLPGRWRASRSPARCERKDERPYGVPPDSDQCWPMKRADFAYTGRTVAPDFPPAGVIAELLRVATLAPSMHNTQPWRFRILRAEQTIELYADPSRMLKHSDPHGRAVHIACGAALFNLRLAVAVAGREPVVRLFPDPGQRLLLAALRLAGPYRPTEADIELLAAVAVRHTNRRPFSNRPVPPGVLAELVQAAATEGATLHLPDQEETARLLYLVGDAERDLLADPGYRAELARWTGGIRDRDGIPSSALGPRDPSGRAPVRDFTPDRHEPVGYDWFEEAPRLAVLSTADGTRKDWMHAGQALQRVLLAATLRGIAVAPLTQPLETADAWLVRDPRDGVEQPQMILRLGYGLPVPGSPRRPVSDVLDARP
jgi:nitroreductase